MAVKAKESDTAVLLRFVREYLDLRKAQKSYFRSKSADHLEDSKRRERALDATAEEILGYTTPSLFDLPPEE